MKKEMLVSTMAIFALLISACAPETQLVPMPTDTPAETRIPLTPTPDDTSTPQPTSTPMPTQTATPIPAWVTDFAEPILNAIKDKPPKFQDDFSNPNSGWQIGTLNQVDPNAQATPPSPGQHFVGERGYVDGEYFNLGERYSCVWSGTNPHLGAYLDFVVEFDVRFFSGKDGDWGLDFRRNDKNLSGFGGSISSNNVSFGKCTETNPECERLAAYSGNQINGGNEWNHFLLIVRGPRMAAYANGTPILYTEDKGFTDEFKMGRFALSVCSGSTPMEIRWDNLKIWDIYNLP